MNLIFLDVDGVLNSIEKDEKRYGDRRPYTDYYYPFNDNCLRNLKTLVEETKAYLVITSTWKNDKLGRDILLSELKKYGLNNKVIGYTEVLHEKKEEEIKSFLELLDESINYIIIDDDSDFDDLVDHLIKTNFEVGLTEEKKEKCIAKLMKR